MAVIVRSEKIVSERSVLMARKVSRTYSRGDEDASAPQIPSEEAL